MSKLAETTQTKPVSVDNSALVKQIRDLLAGQENGASFVWGLRRGVNQNPPTFNERVPEPENFSAACLNNALEALKRDKEKYPLAWDQSAITLWDRISKPASSIWPTSREGFYNMGFGIGRFGSACTEDRTSFWNRNRELREKEWQR